MIEPKSNYASFLNHVLVPADKRDELVIDLFAGCGGLALGFEAQSFETLGFEIDEDCCSTYNANLKGECRQVFITKQTELPKARVIIGGPPCQPFSVNGHQHGIEDARDGFPAFIAAIEKTSPDIWLFENVRGLYYRNKWYLELIILKLRSLGYIVDARLLNAVHYGVPQRRERVFVVGHKGEFKFPESLRFVVTAGEALGEMATSTPEGASFLTSSMDEYVAKYEKASCCKVPRDLHLVQPARTVTCRNLAGATGDMMRVKLPDGRRRRLTHEEGARLQSFPYWYRFVGSEQSRFKQIGNAVPPLLAFHLASSVRTYLDSPYRASEDKIREINSGHISPKQIRLIA